MTDNPEVLYNYSYYTTYEVVIMSFQNKKDLKKKSLVNSVSTQKGKTE